MARRIQGIHHVTAVAGDPQRNVDFYAGFLGLRLVKKTVNFDNPTTYHLPQCLEPMRERIQAALPPVHVPQGVPA